MSQLVLVTGGTGTLGKYVVPALAEAGYSIRLLSRDAEKAKELFKKIKPQVTELDLVTASENELSEACSGVDFVVHLAGVVDFSLSQQQINSINALPAGLLASAAKKQKVKKFVFASSTSLYHNPGGAVNESSPLTPSNAYGKSKILAEQLIRESGVPFVFLRITTIYGAGFENGFLPVAKMIKKEKLPLLGSGENLISLVHASDVANAFVLSLKKPVVNEAMIISGPSIKQSECLNELADLFGVARPKKKVSVWMGVLLAYVDGVRSFLLRKKRRLYPEYVKVLSDNRVFDCSKAEKMLGWKARVDFKDGLEEFVSSVNNKV
ncbi:SDR family NAD(P)-dependent oxidoreductase [Candidatus Micrarchaeota archaeon]|nr:SDR family NAD(P)-dependent oxidoreductase [Candidatus Micrarchaeota archaeon]